MDLKFKSAHLGFWIVLTNFRSSPSALWECGKTVGFSKSLWEVW